MHLPIKAHYATLAMLALAEKFPTGELLSARTIACEHGIPSQFLGQILQQLRFAGLINSTRGSSGGFQLSRDPERISMAELLASVCTTSPREIDCDKSPFSTVALAFWDELEQKQFDTLSHVTLSELCNRQSDRMAQPMFYI